MNNPIPKEKPDRFSPFIYPSKAKHKLTQILDGVDKGFLDVILSRKSDSNILTGLTEIELAGLLSLCTRIRSINRDDAGFVVTKRTCPSAGARHPVDLLISNYNNTQERTLSYYNPLDHSLNELMISSSLLHKFFNEVDTNLSINRACLIWFSIQIKKTSSKYSNAESLFWRDCGALLYCIQLAATYLGYKSCPIGTLAADSFKLLFNDLALVSGGGIIVGK